MSIDLTDEMVATAEQVVIDHGSLVEGDAIDLAWDVVKAAAPLIEAAVREQVAREIRALGAPPVPGYHAETWAYAMDYAAARIARGEQS